MAVRRWQEATDAVALLHGEGKTFGVVAEERAASAEASS